MGHNVLGANLSLGQIHFLNTYCYLGRKWVNVTCFFDVGLDPQQQIENDAGFRIAAQSTHQVALMPTSLNLDLGRYQEDGLNVSTFNISYGSIQVIKDLKLNIADIVAYDVGGILNRMM
jgi:hypothetical protein